jgi:hypothetical protein
MDGMGCGKSLPDATDGWHSFAAMTLPLPVIVYSQVLQ